MRTRGQAQFRLFPAFKGLVYLLFGRISFKLWGLTALLASLSLVATYSSHLHPTFSGDFSRLEAFDFPALIQTAYSPATKDLDDPEIFELLGMVKTPNGIFPFSRKLRVFATSYDKNCAGCNEVTASGLPTGYGVVATDPKVIPLGTKLYIPGYGLAVAGDTGGAVKGNKIDLGFDDVKHGWWSARFVEIYILK